MCLEFPEEDVTYTYREALAAAEHVASTIYRAGAAQGDRVVLMAQNSSQFVRTWCGTALGGLVEVLINTNYEGEFLRHQPVVAQARYAVIDDVQAERWVAVAEHARMVERFWVIDTGQGRPRTRRSRCCARTGGRPTPGRSSSAGHRPAADAEAPGPRRDLLHVRHHRPVQGRRHALLAAVLLRPDRRQPHPAHPEDVYLTTTPLFHGNATFMAAYLVIVAGGRAVIRRKFSASRWIDHVRDSGVTVTNFVGVMMDFAWKQAAARERPRQPAPRRVRAPTASTIVDQFKERYGIEAFLDAFGLTETCAPIMSPYGVPRAAGAAGLQNAEWFDIRLVDPRPTARSRSARSASSWCAGPPVDLQQRVLQHAREDRRGLAEPLVPHRRRAAP